MVKSLKKMLFILCVLTLGAGLFSGCGSSKVEPKNTNETSGTQTQQQTADKDKDYVIKVGYYNCDHMTAAVIAKDMGFYDELGLKVQVTGNGKVPEAMAAGQMDVGYVSTEGLMRAYLKGSPIVIGANNHLGGAYYMVVSNSVKDLKEIVGKKVGFGIDPEKTSASWIQMATELGLPLEGKKYETFKMADSDKYFSLKTGKLAAYTCCDPWASMAEYEKTGRIVVTDGKLPSGEWGSCCIYAMNKNFVQEHPELAKKMVQAHVKALEFIYTHPAKTAEIFAKNYKVPEEVAFMTLYKKTVKEGRSLNWEVDPKKIENEIKFEIDVKTLAKAPRVDEIVNLNLVKEAGVDDFTAFVKDKVDTVFPLGMKYEDWKKKALEIDGKA